MQQASMAISPYHTFFVLSPGLPQDFYDAINLVYSGGGGGGDGTGSAHGTGPRRQRGSRHGTSRRQGTRRWHKARHGAWHRHTARYTALKHGIGPARRWHTARARRWYNPSTAALVKVVSHLQLRYTHVPLAPLERSRCPSPRRAAPRATCGVAAAVPCQHSAVVLQLNTTVHVVQVVCVALPPRRSCRPPPPLPGYTQYPGSYVVHSMAWI